MRSSHRLTVSGVIPKMHSTANSSLPSLLHAPCVVAGGIRGVREVSYQYSRCLEETAGEAGDSNTAVDRGAILIGEQMHLAFGFGGLVLRLCDLTDAVACVALHGKPLPSRPAH